MNLIFIGQEFYVRSKTNMSSIYERQDDGTMVRFSWGEVEYILSTGQEVNIRPATDKELVEAYKKLEQYEK